MKKSLNLTIDESVIQQAKRYAKQRKKSLSSIVEEMLKRNTSENDWQPKPDSITARLSGSLPLPETNKSDDDLLTEALEEKYGFCTDR